MEKYIVLRTFEKGGSNLGMYVLYDPVTRESYIGKYGVSKTQWLSTKRLYALSPECVVFPHDFFVYKEHLMMVTEYMTESVGDYIRNVATFSDVSFLIIIKNVYACWKKLALKFMYVGDDFKFDNVVYDAKTLSVKFIDIDDTSFKKRVEASNLIESAIGFGILEAPLQREFKSNPDYVQRVANIILSVVEERYQSDALLSNLGVKTRHIQCNATQGCTNEAIVMCGNTFKTFYCQKHKPSLIL
jgi:hypothetical protein